MTDPALLTAAGSWEGEPMKCKRCGKSRGIERGHRFLCSSCLSFLAGGGRGRAPASLPGRARPRASAPGGAPEGEQGSMDDLWREGPASEG